MKHILIGRELLINTDDIVSANLRTTNEKGNDCNKIVLKSRVEWTVFSNLQESRVILRAVAIINQKLELIEEIKNLVYKPSVGRESNCSKQIKELL